MKLHPRIEYLYQELQGLNPSKILDLGILSFLKDKGATATEVIVTLHLCYNVILEDAERFVFDSNAFPYEGINEIAFQTFEYLYFNKAI